MTLKPLHCPLHPEIHKTGFVSQRLKVKAVFYKCLYIFVTFFFVHLFLFIMLVLNY